MGATYYQLLILLTTANYPDVMLPAYNLYYLYAWFFVVYFTVAFYFLLNIVIAGVFTSFQKRLECKASERFDHRIDNIIMYLRFKTKEDTLNRKMAADFFGEIFDLDYSRSKDQAIFRKIANSLPNKGYGEIH